MIRFTTGNLLESDAEAIVNTVNTVGVMGKGIALMFKEAFPDNTRIYERACKAGELVVGTMLVTQRNEFLNPKWIVNFPTKKHWRQNSRIEWIESGLDDLCAVIRREKIRSIAIPPLGSGNGGLNWTEVRELVVSKLGDLSDVDIIIYEPTEKYQNVAKRSGVAELTPARALVSEVIRRYSILGISCTLLEAQKLSYFLEVACEHLKLASPLDLRFEAGKFGPYAHRLTHLLNQLDGSYLHCGMRISDAGPFEEIWFDEKKRKKVEVFLGTAESKVFLPALERTTALIDGFESPLGLELLATIHWTLDRGKVSPTVPAVRSALADWPGGQEAAKRKLGLFEDRFIQLAIDRLQTTAGILP